MVTGSHANLEQTHAGLDDRHDWDWSVLWGFDFNLNQNTLHQHIPCNCLKLLITK